MPECRDLDGFLTIFCEIIRNQIMARPTNYLPTDFDYTDNFAKARREQARAVHGIVTAFFTRVGKLIGG